MTEEDKPDERALAEIKRSPLVCEDDGTVSHLLDTAKFEQMQRIAGLMSVSSLMPDHLVKGKTDVQARANCFLVVNQAFRWGFDPFAVAPETYNVGNKLAFQGKLINAVINTRAKLCGRLRFDFSGKEGTDARTVTVSGEFLAEPGNVRQVTVIVGKAKTSNAMWKNDPDQKLIYNGGIKWARAHCPEVILGVLTDDDLERMEENGQIDADGLGKRARYAPLAPPAVLPSPASDAPDLPPVTAAPDAGDPADDFDAAVATGATTDMFAGQEGEQP